MKWYEAWYQEPGKPTVTSVEFPLPSCVYCWGTFDREKAFCKAQQAAQEKRLEVTVRASWGDGTCTRSMLWKVSPAGEIVRK